jgi:hypothetical protein
MNVAALVVGLLGVFAVGHALVSGSAAADGEGFRREDEPLLYWSITAAGAAITCFLLYLGFSGRP